MDKGNTGQSSRKATTIPAALVPSAVVTAATPLATKTFNGRHTSASVGTLAGLIAGVIAVTFLVLGVANYGYCADSPVVLFYDNATGVGAAWETPVTHSAWSCDVIVSDNSTTAVTVILQGNQCTNLTCTAAQRALFSPTGMATYSLSVAELAAGMGTFSAANMPANRLRVKLTTLTGGTNPYVTVRCVGAF